MHVVVIGCGRVGSELAGALEHAGHSVAVVDKNARAFRRLGPDFAGTTVVGFGFDRDHLAQAGIERGRSFRLGDERRQLEHPLRRASPARPTASSTSSPGSTTPGAR